VAGRTEPRFVQHPLGGGEHPVPHSLIPLDHLIWCADSPLHEQVRGADQGIRLEVGTHLLWGPVSGLHVGAGVTKEADSPQMEERWLAALADEMHGVRRGFECLSEVCAVGSEIPQAGSIGPSGGDPPDGGPDADAEPVVLAHEQQRDGYPLTRRV
jgi:hypothetical protein